MLDSIIDKILKSEKVNKTSYFYIKVIAFIEKVLPSFLLLSMRIWMARIFWYSGLTKISDWNSTLYLFKFEYKIPILAPELAACLSTTVELCAPILLVLGFASRLAAVPMICMAMIIQITYLQMTEHFYWIFILITIFIFGAGKFSIDYLIRSRVKK